MSVRNRFLLFFSIALISISSLTACKSSVFSDSATTPTVANAPSAPIQPAPVMADGTRASYADIVERVAPAVVKINVVHRLRANEMQQNQPLSGNDFFKNLPFGNQQDNQQQRSPIERGLGSGVIVSQDGTILTNHHVVDGADKITVEFNDRRTFEAKVVGTDQPSDLAVLKIEAQNLPFLNLGDSNAVRVGDIVLAIGNPLGIGQTVTSGIISAKGRSTGLGDGSFEDFLQTDAPINRGNSGGALINLNGELIGINSQILSTSGGSIGIGFSIPSNMAKPIMEQLLKDGKVRRGQLGVNIQNISEDMVQSLKLKDANGVLVSNVLKASAAEKAGVKRGDIITAVNGERVSDSNTLRNKIASILPGNQVKLTVLRDNSETELTVTLNELSPEAAKNNLKENPTAEPQGAQNGKLGLELLPLTAESAKSLNLSADTKGLIVTAVDPSGAAAEAGINKGDVIMEINRQSVENFEDVQAALEKSGDSPALLFMNRGGRVFYLTVRP